MGTFGSDLPEADLHKHPAISSSAFLVRYDKEDSDRIEIYAEKNLSSHWHVQLIPSSDFSQFWVVLFYKALGSEPSDHVKRWVPLGIEFTPKRQRDHWDRVAVCDHGTQSRNGDCDLPRDECYDRLDEAFRAIQSGEYDEYLPNIVLDDIED